MSVHLPLTVSTTNRALQTHMGSVMALLAELLNPLFQKCLVSTGETRGGNAILKTH